MLNMSSHSLLAYKVSIEKFNYYLTGVLAFLSLFLRFSLAVIFDSLSISLSESLFGFILVGVFDHFEFVCPFPSSDLQVSATISSNRLSNHLFLSSLSETPVMCNWPIKWHPTSPLGSLYSPCFSLCSSDSVISNDLSSSSQILFSV